MRFSPGKQLGWIAAVCVWLLGNAPGVLAQSPIYAYFPITSGNSVAVVDTASDSLVGVIPLDGQPFSIATSPDGARVYVGTLSNTVNVIDAATRTAIASVATGVQPLGVAVSPDSRTVYVTVTGDGIQPGRLMAIEASTLQVQKTIDISGTPVAVAASADGRCVYVGNLAEDRLTIVDLATLATRTIDVPAGSDSVAIGAQPFAYLVNAPSGEVAVANLASRTYAGSVPVGVNVQEIVRHPDGNLYATDSELGQVTIIHAPSNSVRARIQMPTGMRPYAIDLLPSEDKAYVGGSGVDDVGLVAVVDTRLRKVTKTIDLPGPTYSKGRFISPYIVNGEVPAGCLPQ